MVAAAAVVFVRTIARAIAVNAKRFASQVAGPAHNVAMMAVAAFVAYAPTAVNAMANFV